MKMCTVGKVIANVYLSMEVVMSWGCLQLLHSLFQLFGIADWVNAIGLTAVEELNWELHGGTIHKLCCIAM